MMDSDRSSPSLNCGLNLNIEIPLADYEWRELRNGESRG